MYDSGVITAPCDGIVTGVDAEGAFLLSASGQEYQAPLLLNSASVGAPAYSVILLSKNSNDKTGKLPENEDSENKDPGSQDDTIPGKDIPPDTHPGQEEPSFPVYSVRVGQVEEEGFVTVNPFTYSDVLDLSTVPTVVTEGGSAELWPTAGLYNRDLTTFYEGTASEGNILFEVTTETGAVFYVFAAVASSGQQQQPQQGDMGSAMGGGGGSLGMTPVPVFEPYSLETLTIASVTSQEEMTLEITVDEQDIARLHTGQEATITVDALTGQSFPATVTAVSNTGTNEGGSSKFTAKLTLSKTGDMLPGMNASAFLTLEIAENVLSIPAAALVEDGTRTVVYTACSEQDALLKNPVEVTTGVSDGDYVEILSGLAAGDSVYYAYYDTLEISNRPNAGGFGF